MFQPTSILITGAAGFIGSHFVDYCLQQPHVEHVISLDLLTYAGSKQNLAQAMTDPRHQFIQANISDSACIAQLMQTHQIDTIVNFAAESHVDRSIDAPIDFIQTNIVGTYHLLDTAKQVWSTADTPHRFHHISTDEVYGTLSSTDPAFTERTPYSPNSPYSASKASADHLVNAFHHTYDLPTITTNCSNNYGPRQFPEKLIPVIIQQALKRAPIPIYGDGSNRRDWLYVVDHCDGIWKALTEGQPGACYNIGGDCEQDNLTLAQHICDLLDVIQPSDEPYRNLITFVTDRPGHDWRYAVDHSQLTALTGWQPATTLTQGLKETIDFYLNNGSTT